MIPFPDQVEVAWSINSGVGLVGVQSLSSRENKIRLFTGHPIPLLSMVTHTTLTQNCTEESAKLVRYVKR